MRRQYKYGLLRFTGSASFLVSVLLSGCVVQQGGYHSTDNDITGKQSGTDTIESMDIDPSQLDTEEFGAYSEIPEVEEQIDTSTEVGEVSSTNLAKTYSGDSETLSTSSLLTPPSDALILYAKDNDTFREAVNEANSTTNTFIQINISSGTFSGQYSLNIPNKTVQIVADNTTFNGGGASGYWLQITGDNARIEITSVTVSNYCNGINFDSGYTYKNVSEPYNEVSGMSGIITNSTFEELGDAYCGGDGYAAVHAKNSVVEISNSVFSNLINYDKPSNIHAIYIVSGVSSTITNNVFSNVSGDPIRLRSSTRNTAVTGNVFNNSGGYGFVSDWYCNASCAAKHSQAVEKSSEAPYMSGNSFGSSYGGGQIPSWTTTS